jgi:hypothetical protein
MNISMDSKNLLPTKEHLLKTLTNLKSVMQVQPMILWTPTQLNPEIKIKPYGRISTSTMSPLGFLDISATSDYIYALFSGRTFNEYGGNFGRGETVYVFDWNLNPVCSYILEYDTNSITVCENNKKMFAFGITEDNQVKLFKYLLNH